MFHLFLKSLLLSACFIFIIIGAEIHIQYGLQHQELDMFKLFYDKNDGYYMDIGAYDPIMYSNTIYFYGRGWKGLNFEANPTRAARFPYGKTKDTSFNYVVGEEDKYLTLHQYLDDASQSTVSPQVSEFLQKRSNQLNPNSTQDKIVKIQVPSLSMKQICERFIIRRPNLLNLDIQGFGFNALSSNDWNNTKCRPEIIVTQLNHLSRISNLGDSKKYLESKGYKFFMQLNINAFFIDGQVFDHYSQKYKQGAEILKKMKIVRLPFIIKALSKYMNLSDYQNPIFIQNNIDPFYFYYPQQGDLINLQQINLESNKISQKKDRPIIIVQFDPKSNLFYIPSKNFKKEEVKVGQFNFFRFNVTKQDGSYFLAYILDKQWENPLEIKVLFQSKTQFSLISDSRQLYVANQILQNDIQYQEQQHQPNAIQKHQTKELQQHQQKEMQQHSSTQIQELKAFYQKQNELKIVEEVNPQNQQNLLSPKNEAKKIMTLPEHEIPAKKPMQSQFWMKSEPIFSLIQIILLVGLIVLFIVDRLERRKNRSLQRISIEQVEVEF